MNMAVLKLNNDYGDYPLAGEVCWYFVGDGVTVWRESDGHSPVEPKGPTQLSLARSVPGD